MKRIIFLCLYCQSFFFVRSQTLRDERVVPNIDALRNIKLPIVEGTVIKVSGYRVPGDGGGGNYEWNSSSKAEDDKGAIISINAKPANGRFIHEVVNGIVNLKWWGVQAYEYKRFTDYDISDEFNAAQLFLKMNPEWTSIYIPCDTAGAIGAYYCSKTLTILNSIKIFGDKYTRIEWPAYTTCINIPYKDQLGIVMKNYISDLDIFQAFTTTYGDSTAHGIKTRSIVVLNNVRVSFASGDAFYLEGCQIPGDPIEGTVDFSELNNCTATQSNNGLYINGCDANKINVYKFNATAIRRWGVYDNGFLGNTYVSPHFAFCGSGTGSDVVVTYKGTYYSAVSEYNFVNKGFRPDLHPKYWQRVTPMGKGPAWDTTKKYYSGGPYWIRNDNARTTIIDPYFEAYQPNARNSINTLSMGGARGVDVNGGADFNINTTGLGLNTSLEINGKMNGIHINSPSTISSYPGIAVNSHEAFPTVFHESSTQPYVYERYKNTNNDRGYFVYQGTSFYVQPDATTSLEVTPVTIKLPAAVESTSSKDKVLVMDPTSKEVKFTSPISLAFIPSFIYGEEFTGSTSKKITLAHAGISGTLRLFKNGLRLALSEFSYNGGTSVTLTNARLSSDIILADYNYN